MIPFELSANDRILIMAPHPDDEVLGCAGIIQRAKAMNLPVHVVFFTYGDYNEWSFMIYRRTPVLTPTGVRGMGLIRHDEAVAADGSLGLTPDDLTFLGYPDFGTLSILASHWLDAAPYRSILTKVHSVPYPNAFHPGAPYKGEEVLSDLEKVIRDFQPTKIFVSHPADQHPDHQAMYIFTRIALWELKLSPEPALYPYLVHYKRWPKPHGYHPNDPLLPPPGSFPSISWSTRSLSPDETNRKLDATKLHRSQFRGNPKYLLSFIRTDELFGDFPENQLPTSTASTELPESPENPWPDIPEQLTSTERASFLGFAERTVDIKEGNLEISVSFTRPIAMDVAVSLYVFGYRNDKPFADMPKLHVEFGAIEHRVLNQDSALPAGTVKLTRHRRGVTILIPLQTLGDPDRIITGGRSYLGDVPLDWLSWRIFDLPAGGTGTSSSGK